MMTGLLHAQVAHRDATDREAIAAAGRAFSAAYVANDTTALGELYADSATLLPPGRTLRGREAIRRYFAWKGDYRQLEHAMVPDHVTVDGNLAVDVGKWTSVGRRGDAPPTTASGTYLVVWVRESDGGWRILYDMWHRPAPDG
jgi:uncharacterized protein (TIGR02246 family)